MCIVPVRLGDRSYSIKIGGGLLARLGRECGGLDLGGRAAIITDSNVGPLLATASVETLKSLAVPSSEQPG